MVGDGVEFGDARAVLAAEITRRREEAGLSRGELAELVGYSRDYVGRSEKPRKGLPSAELVEAIDRALGARDALVRLRARAAAEQLRHRSGGRADTAHLAGEGAALVAAAGRAAADGGAVPAGILGEHEAVGGVSPGASGEEDEIVKRRRFLGHAAAVAVGAFTFDMDRWQALASVDAAGPERLGSADVEAVEDLIAVLRALDYQQGGGTCRELAMAQLARVHGLMSVPAPEPVGRRLRLAVADLHNLVGWTCHDIGLTDAGRRHFGQALELAQAVDEPSLVANVLYRAGRLHLHHGWPEDALRLFQLGQIAAKDSGSSVTVALLCANEAWAYSHLGDGRQATASLLRARDEFARADPAAEPGWSQFFGEADLDSLDGAVHLELAQRDSHTAENHAAVAVQALTRSLAARGPDMARSRAFETTMLGTAHLLVGDRDQGVAIGHQAAEFAASLRSKRVRDRLAPLQRAASTHNHADARELAVRAHALLAL